MIPIQFCRKRTLSKDKIFKYKIDYYLDKDGKKEEGKKEQETSKDSAYHSETESQSSSESDASEDEQPSQREKEDLSQAGHSIQRNAGTKSKKV